MPETIAGDEVKKGWILPFRGMEYSLVIVQDDGKKTRVFLKDGLIIVKIDRKIPLAQQNIEISKGLREWYKKSAKSLITERLLYFADKLSLRYNNVRIKDQKTRWGSCSRLGNLNFNWRLVMMPQDILDYVVVHELCHLVQMNHSEKFWQLVRIQVPDYKEKRLWLRKHGAGFII